MPGNPTDNPAADRGVPEHVAELIVRYYDNDLTGAGLDGLRQALKQSAEARAMFARWGLHVQVLSESLSPQYRGDEGDNPAEDPAALGIVPDADKPLLARLTALERSSKGDLIGVLYPKGDSTVGGGEQDGVTGRDVLAVAGYLTLQAARTKPVKWLAAAAVVLIAAMVFFTLFEQSDPVQPPEITSNTPTGPGIEQARVVATLTAERGALWDRRPGDDLFVGQRFTLLDGFAEVTTARGAVAILEAPAVIELIDHDNAVRLHTGKLVGLCHTPASQGFVVKTDYADVTDLGTEFGVEVRPDGMDATVFVGEIEISLPGRSPQRVQHSQTARLSSVDDTDRGLVIEDRAAKGFVRRLPRSALIAAASINLDGFTVEVVPNGVYEDVKLYTDRDHELNGLDAAGLPHVLIGGDLVRMPASARPHVTPEVGDKLRLEIELTQPADIYALVSKNAKIGDWLERDYVRTGLQTGVDYVNAALHNVYNGGVGPGESIDNIQEVWKRKQPAVGRIVAGESLKGGVYVIVAVPRSPPDQ